MRHSFDTILRVMITSNSILVKTVHNRLPGAFYSLLADIHTCVLNVFSHVVCCCGNIVADGYF